MRQKEAATDLMKLHELNQDSWKNGRKELIVPQVPLAFLPTSPGVSSSASRTALIPFGRWCDVLDESCISQPMQFPRPALAALLPVR
jgi:hypothetical protein